MENVRIEVTGIVQGVGFRPFVYRLAKRIGVKGCVRNAGNSVEIDVHGSKRQVKAFIHGLKTEAPPLARIDSINVEHGDIADCDDFRIVESKLKGGSMSILPPDVSICQTCLEEIRDKRNRRHFYPFTVCVDCGARYTIIEDVPYDREKTSMVDFPMCPECAKEYNDPGDRRFHAEPTCCPVCGPKYTLYNGRAKMEGDDPIKEAVRRLESGFIVAVMGIGGTPLASKLDDRVIHVLRKKFDRRGKPFTIMARDVRMARKFAWISECEKELLTSLRRPVLLLDKKKGVPESIAPGLDKIGIMLPYTALHHMLFEHTSEEAFVMTSDNLPGEPMFISPLDVISSGFS